MKANLSRPVLCPQCAAQREEIARLREGYEERAMKYRDHRGVAAAHMAYALGLALAILDRSDDNGRGHVAQPAIVCALPEAEQEPCPT